MKNQKLKLGAIALALSVAAFAASRADAQTVPLTAGDLVVSVYGNTGTSTANGTYLDGQATPISLEEFSSALVPADTDTPTLTETLPDAGTGANVGIVGEFGSSSEGTLELSGNGQYLTIGGYDGNLDENNAPSGGYGGGNTAEAQSTDANVPRVAALINISTGAVDTSTVLNDVYNTNNPRGVYTQNGSSIYISGQGASKTDEGGIYTTPVGTNTTTGGYAPTPIFNVVSTRALLESNVNAASGNTSSGLNLYYSADQNSSSKGTQTGIFEYSGTPTTSQGSSTGTRITAANNGLAGSAMVNYSPEGFFFANSTTLYVADTGDPKAGGTGDGGIQKWSYSAGIQKWVLDYTLTASTFVSASQATSASDGETGFEALTGQVVGGVVDLYAVSYTAGDADPNGLYAEADTLSATTDANAADSMVELEQAPSDSNFKGVAFIPAAAPEPSTWALVSVGFAGLVWQLRRRIQIG